MKYTRITANLNQMGGLPCIRDLSIPVAKVVEMVAQGMDTEAILEHFPELEAEDIKEALQFAAETVQEGVIPPIPFSGR